MKMYQRSIVAAGFVLGGMQAGFAAEGGDLPIQLNNRLRVEFDDNVRQAKDNADSSVNIIEDAEFIFDLTGENTFLGLRYMPSFVWYSDREEDDTDLHHQVDASLRHAFSPDVELSLKEILRFSEQPELMENDVIVRENNDYLYNSVNAGLGFRLSPTASVDLEGRHEMVGYTEDNVADANDWSKLVGGANLNYFLSQLTTLSGEARMIETSYEDDIRSSTTYQFGLGLNTELSKGVFAEIRAGGEQQEYDDVDLDDQTEPYVSGGLTLVPNDSTKFNVGAGYALAQTPVSRFVSQGRTSLQAGMSYNLSARLTANASASFATGDFEADQLVSGSGESGPNSGSEDVTRLSARLTYEVSKTNYLEAGWQYVDLSSDIRPESDYERNRIALGWKTILK